MDILTKKLNQRQQDGTLRSFMNMDGMIDFCSNDYLGFSKFSCKENGDLQNGSTGSRLISGNSFEAIKAEAKVSEFFNSPSALIFNSGYDANLGFFSSVPQKNDLVLYDKHIHASVRDGIRLSFAKSVSFEHNSLVDLRSKLQLLKGENKFVAIESLYSMDGDMSDIVPIVELCEEYGAFLIVDEAHSVGVYGHLGKGIANAFEVENRIFARLVTFGKAYGSHGAAVLGSEVLKKYLINFARSFIYTTALPPENYHRIGEIITLQDFEIQRNNLFDNISTFRNSLDESTFKLISEINSPIQILQIGDANKSISIAENCKKNGFAVKAILWPTVPKGLEGLRFGLHSFNTKVEIEEFVEVIKRS